MTFNNELTDELKTRLLAENVTNDSLYELLKKVDPESAKQIHRHNTCRVLRALEIYYLTGKRKSEHLSDQNFNTLSKLNFNLSINIMF